MSVTLDALATETAWLRRLARSLVHDTAAAEDLVHDAYVAAAERPPDAPLKPWLVRVMANLSRMRFRGEARRSARERAVAELASAPAGPDELVERLELHRMLAGMVLELPQLSRDLVLLTFFEGMSSSAAGKRLGIPASTVRRRLQQALHELRTKLDDRKPRKAWMAALAGFGWPRKAAAGLPWLVAAGVALLLVAGWLAVQLRADADPVVRAGRGHRRDATATAARDGKHADVPPAERARLMAAAPAPVVGGGVLGRVVDGEGQPIAGAEVTLSCTHDVADPFIAPPPAVMRSGADGSFAFALAAAPFCSLLGRKDNLAGFTFPAPGGDDLRVTELILAPTVATVIHVVDATTGAPVAGARVRALSLIADTAEATTDERGDAHLDVLGPPVPRAEHHLLTRFIVAHPGHVDAEVRLSSVAELQRVPAATVQLHTGVRLRGEVRDASERPVAGARVTIREAALDVLLRSVHADRDGRFDLQVRGPGPYQLGAGTADLVSIDVGTTDIPAAGLDDVVLHVVPRTQTGVEGVVVDEQGAPVAGATVTAWGVHPVAPVTSDAQGRFAIRVVRARLRLLARVGERASELVGIEAVRGEVVHTTLRVARAGVTGVVVDGEGHSIAGAQVWLNTEATPAIGVSLIRGARYFTDANGAFAIDVPRGRFRLSVRRSFDDDFLDEDDVWVEGGSRDVKLVLP